MIGQKQANLVNRESQQLLLRDRHEATSLIGLTRELSGSINREAIDLSA
jgi:hypothetical protein